MSPLKPAQSQSPLPRPRTLDEAYNLILLVAQRVDALSNRVEVVANGQLDMSGQMGRIIAAVTGIEQSIANLRASLEPGGPVEMRARMASAHDLEKVAARIERSAEDIIETAEEITSPGTAPHKSDSDPVRRWRADEALKEQERARDDRRAIKRQVIGGVILALLLALVAYFTGRGGIR